MADGVGMRAVHPRLENARIGREALQEPPLAFTEKDVVGQGRFAAAGNAADQRQLLKGDLQRDGFEVVFAAAGDGDEFRPFPPFFFRFIVSSWFVTDCGDILKILE